jgi:hypothetical protein
MNTLPGTPALNAPHYRIELMPDEVDCATIIGTGRNDAWGNGNDAAHYADESKRQDDRTAHIAAACCECAVARLLDLHWTAGTAWDRADHDQNRHLPDVGKNVEVRRIRFPNASTFAVRERDKGRIMVAAFAEPPEFIVIRILGWISANRAWEVGQPTDNYRRTGIHHLKLTPPDGLPMPPLRQPGRELVA